MCLAEHPTFISSCYRPNFFTVFLVETFTFNLLDFTFTIWKDTVLGQLIPFYKTYTIFNMIKKIITYPNPILRKKCKPVTTFDSGLQNLIEDMAETMFNAPGAGLAANQLGEDLQLAIINTSDPENEDDHQYMALINPKIITEEGTQVDTEGCLSVIDYTSKVKRAQKIVVQAQDAKGQPFELEAEDFQARVIQHEYDHLIGKVFIDRISSLKRSLYKKKLKKILAEQD